MPEEGPYRAGRVYESEYTIKSPFITVNAIATATKGKDWEKDFLPWPDDIPSASYDHYTHDILRILRNLCEMDRSFTEYNIKENGGLVNMAPTHNSMIRYAQSEAFFSKGLMGAGAKLATTRPMEIQPIQGQLSDIYGGRERR